MSTRNKIASVAVAVTTIVWLSGFTAFVPTARADHSTDHTIQQLLAQIATLNAQLLALQGGGAPVSGCTPPSENLTPGSTSPAVKELQMCMNALGHTVAASGAGSPGNETQYFGSLTKAAVTSFQQARGIAAGAYFGYYGPLTRAELQSAIAAAPPPTTPPPAPPGAPPTTPPPAAFANPGETILTIREAPSPAENVKVYEGDMKTGLIGVEAEAKSADALVERIRLDLGTNASAHIKIFSRFYVMDGGTVLAEASASDVVKDGTRYVVNLTGINAIVPVNTKKVFTVAADLYSSIKSGDACVGTNSSACTMTIPVNGVRATDSTGIQHTAPSTALENGVIVTASLIDSAELKLSLNTSTPKKQEVIATSGTSNNEMDDLTLLVFDVRAEKDSVKITDLNVNVTTTGSGGATASPVHLYDGTTRVSSATVSGSEASFTTIDYVIPKDTTKTLTLKADIRSAALTTTTFTASTSPARITAENSQGTTIGSSSKTGSATGQGITVRHQGLEISLVSKTIEKTQTPINNNISTSTVKGTFTLRVKARGAAITMGTLASTTPLWATTTSLVYANSVQTTLNVASSTDYSTPSGVVTSGIGSNSFQLGAEQTVDIPVSFQFEGRTLAGVFVTSGSYAVGVEGIRWVAPTGGTQTSNFMAGEVDWRTSSVSLP